MNSSSVKKSMLHVTVLFLFFTFAEEMMQVARNAYDLDFCANNSLQIRG